MDTRRLRIGCEFVYHAEIPTPTVFQVQPSLASEVLVADEWPEQDVRRREWVDPVEAIERVEEAGLKEIIEAVCRQTVAAD